MRKFSVFLAIPAAVALACAGTAIAMPTADVNAIVTQTMLAYTVEAALTYAAVPSPTIEVAPTNTAAPTPTVEVVSPTQTQPASPAPEENAPDPLPASHTGVILNNGECFNFDNGQVTPPDGQCDVWLAEPALFRQQNGAQLSGYVTLLAPTRSHCASGRYEPGDLAVQTDLYMCFITNEGRIGFVVVRQYRGEAPFTGIVFDYWVFE